MLLAARISLGLSSKCNPTRKTAMAKNKPMGLFDGCDRNLGWKVNVAGDSSNCNKTKIYHRTQIVCILVGHVK